MGIIDEKYPDSPRNSEINSLCTNSRFGTEANFESAVDPLLKMVAEIVQLEDLDYRKNLTQSEINNIESARNTVLGFINEIKSFSIAFPNPVEQRNQIVSRIESYYQNSFATYTHQPIIYLRGLVRENAKDEKQLRELVNKTSEINKELEDRLEKIKIQEKKLEEDEQSVIQRKGIVSSRYLSKEFSEESKKAEARATRWETHWVLSLSITLPVVLVALFLGYFFWIRNLGDKYLSIEYGISGITLVAIIFFYLRIVLRNSNIEKHSASLNRHRGNVAATIENLLTVADKDEILKSALLKEASISMFATGSTGYLDQE